MDACTDARWLPPWSTQELADFAGALSGLEDDGMAACVAIERAAVALHADFTALVRDGRVVASVGFSPDPPPAAALAGLPSALGSVDVELPGVPGPLAGAVAELPVGTPGHLVVLRRSPGGLTTDEVTLARGMARVLGLALRSIETLGGLRERQALLERLSRIQQSIARRADLAEVLDAITQGAADLLGEPAAALRLVTDEDPSVWETASAVGFDRELLDRIRSGAVGEGAGGRAIADGELVVLEDYEASRDRLGGIPHGTVQAAMAAPVREAGAVVGSLVVASYVPGRSYSGTEREVLTVFAEHAGIALMDARTVAGALHAAMHDPLTSLPNRSLFRDRLAHALVVARRRGARTAVLFLDLDHFKLVNDTEGHEAGDELLVAVAGRLREHLRAADTIARFGGDEFAVLLEDVRSDGDAARAARTVVEAFERPLGVRGREFFVTTSIGVAVSEQDGNTAPERLVRDADAAMYRAKARGGSGYELFNAELRRGIDERLRVERELGDALRRGELRLALQPIFGMPDRRLLGAEALVRWEHPERGPLPPAAFIPIAEQSGLIVPLGRWVVEAACAELEAWRDLQDVPLRMAVNVSTRQLRQSKLVGTVAEALARHGLEGPELELDIAESVLLDDVEAPRDTLLALHDLGVGLMLDDFGTGFASLGYLRRLPLDGLKIDRSFVSGLGRDPEAAAIVEAITAMGKALGLALVGEGVEDVRQLGILGGLGVDRVQGYLLGHPMTPDRFRALIAERAGAGAIRAA